MTDRDAAGHDGGVIEIELTGDGPLSPLTPAALPDGGQPQNWRRAIGIALIAGTFLGIGGALVLRALEDDGGATTETPASTVPADELSTLITTPPTLTPLQTLPPADFDPAEPLDDSPQPTTSQDRALFDDMITPPSYPEVDSIPLSEVLTYTIAPAVEALGEDVARRSHTRVELGVDGYVIEVTIERDPMLDRYQLVFEQGGLTQVAIVDIATGTTYVNPGTDNLETILNAELIAGSDATDVNEYFDRFLLGPVRTDSFSAPGTQGGTMHELDGVGPARQFSARVPGDSVPEWQIYPFSPVTEFRPEDRPANLDYLVYVDERGDIVQVDGVSMIGEVPQTITHRIERLDEGHRVELPETPVASPTTAPATEPSSTDG